MIRHRAEGHSPGDLARQGRGRTAPEYRKLADAQHARAAASGDAEAIQAAAKVREIASVYELYEKAKVERQAVDFGDLIMSPTLLLEQNEFACVQRRVCATGTCCWTNIRT